MPLEQSVRSRLAELIESARSAVGQLQPGAELDSAAIAEATWKTSRAAGFLEACAWLAPALAESLMADFESLARKVNSLTKSSSATLLMVRPPQVQSSVEARNRRREPRPGDQRRLTIRQPDRRLRVRRIQGDRRAS
jgi:hypothetical protein